MSMRFSYASASKSKSNRPEPSGLFSYQDSLYLKTCLRYIIPKGKDIENPLKFNLVIIKIFLIKYIIGIYSTD